MKHNHTIERVPRSGTSPWARYNKRPYIYSQSYYKWFREMAGHVAANAPKGDANAQ